MRIHLSVRFEFSSFMKRDIFIGNFMLEFVKFQSILEFVDFCIWKFMEVVYIFNSRNYPGKFLNAKKDAKLKSAQKLHLL